MTNNLKLLTPIQVGPLTLKNRVMFPPLTTGYEEQDGSIAERSFNFYTRLAKGGTSYIVIGDVAPVRTASPTPKLYDESQIPTFKKLADSLHEYDCKLALQLFYPEYDVPTVGKMIAGSMMALQTAQKAKAEGDMATFQAKMEEAGKLRTDAYTKIHHDTLHFATEATVEQLTTIKNLIAKSAAMAQEAGVDAIEIHGDRLVGSLCSTILNKREDQYGGSLENRTRYALELVQAIHEAAPNMMIEYKLPIITINSDGSLRGKGGLLEDEAVEFAKMLEKAGVHMIQVAQANHTGNMGDTIPPMGTVPYNWTLSACEKVKAVVSIPVATVGRVVSVEAGEQILQEEKADIIGYGRSLLCDADIANKAATGEPIRQCLNCNKGCVDNIQNRKYLSCILNAENGDEGTIFLKPLQEKKHVVIVGAGIAGLEAARVAAKRGHTVDIYDLADHIGGQVILASIPPRKSEILRSIDYYKTILPQLGVQIHLETECTKDIMNAADEVIVAVGAHDIKLPIQGAEDAVSSWDILEGNVEPKANCAIIGGGLVGTETAEYVLEKGSNVSIVEMLDAIAQGESATILPIILEDFKNHNVQQYVSTKVERIENNGTKVIATKDGETIEIECDQVIFAVGSKKNEFDTEGVNKPIHYIGDCSKEKTASISEAIRSAYHTANEL